MKLICVLRRNARRAFIGERKIFFLVGGKFVIQTKLPNDIGEELCGLHTRFAVTDVNSYLSRQERSHIAFYRLPGRLELRVCLICNLGKICIYLNTLAQQELLGAFFPALRFSCIKKAYSG